MKQLEARKLNEFMKATPDKTWRDRNSLLIEIQDVAAVGGVNRDTNGDSLTVELRTRLFQTQRVLIVASSTRGSNLVTLFFRAGVHERGDRHRATVIVYKDPKGQRQYTRVPHIHYGSQEDAKDRLKSAFQLDADGQLLADLTQDVFYSSVIRRKAREALEAGGYKVEEVMEFSHEFMFTPKFIRQSKTAVEFGWMTFGTYQSHPCTLKVSKRSTDPKMIPLTDLGAEEAGYYSHDNKSFCRPEDAPALKRFAKQFKSKLTK